ncbi:MAG TPA: hypothetical protein VGG49_02040 [Steroidobacteraceae bacterium]|jgi:hypothetical protein
MSKERWLPLLLVAMAIAPLQVMAQDPATTADVRCVVVGIRSAALPDSRQKSTGLLMALYYIGRLDGRDPKLDLRALLTEQLANMTSADFEAEAVRCSNALKDKGAQITHFSQDLLKPLK